MLVLSRDDGEKITIGDNIVVTLVRSHCGGARIGVDAPSNVPVHRLEVKEAIDKEAEDAE
jgi:carbon storage regulator